MLCRVGDVVLRDGPCDIDMRQTGVFPGASGRNRPVKQHIVCGGQEICRVTSLGHCPQASSILIACSFAEDGLGPQRPVANSAVLSIAKASSPNLRPQEARLETYSTSSTKRMGNESFEAVSP